MSDKVKPGNIVASSISSLLAAQQEAAKETTTKEEVKQRIQEKKEELNNNKVSKKNDNFVFKGFRHTLKTDAKTDYHMPITNINFRLTPIKFKEELSLAQTIVHEGDLFLEIMKLVYNHIIEGPEKVTKSFESFLENVAEKDSTALLYAFYLISYGHEFIETDTFTCKSCNGTHKVQNIRLIDLYKEEPYIGEPFEALHKEVKLDLTEELGCKVNFYFKFPSIAKSLKNKNLSKKNFLHDVSNLSIGVFMSKFTTEEDNEIITFKDDESIRNAIDTLNSKARKKVQTFLKENFFKYGIKLEYKWICKNQIPDEDSIDKKATKDCGVENITTYDIIDLFFREISESIS